MNKEEINKLKSKMQDDIAELSVLHPALIIEAGTGFGKSWALIKSIHLSKSKKRWLVVVPEIAQIANFKQEIINSGININDKIEDVICYASLKNYANTQVNIALNEVQSLNDNRLEIVQTIEYDRIIADSATIPDDIKYNLSQLGNFHTYSLPLKEAINLGILPEPKIFVIKININSITDKFEYTKFGKKYSVIAAEYYQYLSDQVKYWRNRFNRENEMYMQNKSLQFASMRKRFMATLKTIKAKEFVDKFIKEKRRFIVFSGTIPQSEEICSNKKLCVHSKKSSKVNAKTIEDFNDLKTSEIYATGMLVSGMTLSKLDTGLVVQLDSGENDNGLKITQQIGRILRDNNPEMYILVLEDSKDEDYLKTTINSIGKEFFNYL